MTFETKPSGAPMARLLRNAVAQFGRPRYLITDIGGDFIAGVFTKTVARFDVTPRYAWADRIRATARPERFWKTLKKISGVRVIPPLNLSDPESRLSCPLAFYAFHRPHTALGNRTPMMAFLGEPAPPTPRSPRRSVLGPSVSDRVSQSGPGSLPGLRASLAA